MDWNKRGTRAGMGEVAMLCLITVKKLPFRMQDIETEEESHGGRADTMIKRLLVMDGSCPGPECDPASAWTSSSLPVTPAPGEILQEWMLLASMSLYGHIHMPFPHTQLKFKQTLITTHCTLTIMPTPFYPCQ